MALVGAASMALSRQALAQGYYYSDPYANAKVTDQNVFRHPKATQSNEPVGVQLALAMDTSGSMEDEEFAIELQATSYALNSQLFRTAVKYKGGEKSVAICLLDFQGSALMRVPWIDIRGNQINDKPYKPDPKTGKIDPDVSSYAPDILDELCKEIENLPRRGNGGTTVSSAVDLAKKLFLACPWQPAADGGKRVLDLFGDGSSWAGDVQRSRDEAAAIGVTINAFAIVNEEPDLDKFFKENLVTQKEQRSSDGVYSEPGRVWAVARNMKSSGNKPAGLRPFFEEVARGMQQKVTVEVAGVTDYFKTLTRLGLNEPAPVPSVSGPAKLWKAAFTPKG